MYFYRSAVNKSCSLAQRFKTLCCYTTVCRPPTAPTDDRCPTETLPRMVKNNSNSNNNTSGVECPAIPRMEKMPTSLAEPTFFWICSKWRCTVLTP